MALPNWLAGKYDSAELKDLADQVKSARTLVEVVWSIGKAVAEKTYDKLQADQACAGYRKRYAQRHARIKILGMSEPVNLESVYTEVRIVPPDYLRGYRSQEELQDLYIGQERSHSSGVISSRSGLDVANEEKHQFLNVLGAPGAGKTTFLRYIGMMALESYRRSTTGQIIRQAEALPYRFNLLPVLLELRSLGKRPTDYELLIDEELRISGFPTGFGRAALRAGGLLVLLDGLDEVTDDRLEETISGIRDLVDQHSRCRFVMSCRTAFYKDYFNQFTDVLLTEFSNKQIQNLIQNWFHSDHDREVGTAATLWELLEKREHWATRELARTPLLAAFLCLVYDVNHTLPTNRSELYGDALQILLQRWSASNRVHAGAVHPGMTTKRELLMLEQLAGPSYEREQYFFKGGELAGEIESFLLSDADGPEGVDGRKVLEEIEQKQGLIVQRARDTYSFSHLTLQEYLAASHYYKGGRSAEIAKETLIQQRWREVHLLLAGLQEPNADRFLLELAIAASEQVVSRPLKALLSWASRVVEPANSPQETAGWRAALLSFSLALGHALNDLSARASDGSNLARAHLRAINLIGALAPRLPLQRARALDLDRARALGVDRYGHRELERAVALITLNPYIVKEKQRARFDELFRRHSLQNPGDRASVVLTSNGMITVFQELAQAVDIPKSARCLSVSSAEECLLYLGSVLRVCECREAAQRVTQAGWDRVCERLLSPSQSS